MRPVWIACGVFVLALAAVGAAAQVTTSQYDNLRTGATLSEKTLTPLNVNAQQFGRLGAFKVDGAVYAQPLFLPAVEIPGKGKHDVTKNGEVRFDPLRENPRAALLLANSTVYLAWGSSCDVDPYHGWVIAYDAQTLAQKAVLNVTPDGSEGGIWGSDTGLGADASGNV